jgi:NADH-quinone oxidoreductase subunit A
MANSQVPALWPLAVYCGAVLALVAGLMVASHVLGEGRKPAPADAPFESGIVGIGFGHFRVPVAFYLVAMFFVVFDLEAAFLFAWAVALRQSGWQGFIEAVVFILILFAALVYIWRLGGLDWAPRRSTGGVREQADAVRDQAG